MTCTTCGAALEPGDTICPVCSAPVTGEASPPPEGSDVTGGPGVYEGPPPPPAGTTSGTTGGTYAAVPHPSGLSSEVRGWGIAAHLAGLGGAMLTVITLGFLGPLLIWLVKRDEHPFIDHHAKEALNFQLTTLVALVVAALAAIPVVILGVLTLGVLWLVAAAVILAASVVWFVFPILGAVRASNGDGFRYPVSIRFVR